ncbi:MAG: DUF3077 domain-containing protein [Pseudomonas sp.]
MIKPLITTEEKFSEIGDQSIFSVTPGIDAETALTKASNLLSTITDSIELAGMGTPLEGNQAWMVLHSLESAKAVIDALWATLQFDSPDPVEA